MLLASMVLFVACTSTPSSDAPDLAGGGGAPPGGPPPTADAPPTVFYASPSGSGDACTVDARCGLLAAQEKVHLATPSMAGDVVVDLAGGTYVLEAPLVLSPDVDSGTHGHSVIWRAHGFGAAGAATPVLSGGRTITGFSVHDAQKHVYRADVGDLETRQLYVGGVRARRARLPASALGSLDDAPGGYHTASTAPQAWRNATDTELVFHDGSIDGNWLWAEPRCPVAGIAGDGGGTTITAAEPCFGIVNAQRGKTRPPTWIENVFEALGPGTFYLDRGAAHAHVLYYVPRDGEDLQATPVIAPVLETVVKGAGTLDAPLHDVAFEGLTFAYGTWLGPSTPHGFPEASYNKMGNTAAPETQVPGNVDFFAARRVRFEGDTFAHLGGVGLNLDDGSQNDAVVGCVFGDISSNGIQIGNVDRNAADGPALVADNLVANNYVHDVGAEYPGAYGLWNANTQRTTVMHNHFAHLPRGGIASNYTYSAGPGVATGHLFAYNLVEDYMNGVRDGGGFDTNGSQYGPDGAHPGSVLLGNVFREDHDNFGQIYLDFNSTGYTLQNNLAYASKSLDYNTIDSQNQSCCNRHLANFYDQNNAFKYQVAEDMVVGDTVLPPEAMPASILQRAGLEPAYRRLAPAAPALTDTKAPSAPAAHAEDAGAGPSLTIAWTASSDDVGVTGYEIDDGDLVLAAVTGSTTRATVSLPTPGMTYTLVVRARDAAGNLSPPSAPVVVAIPGAADLVGHWTFDTGGADASGSRNDGAVTAAGGTKGILSGALAFDGATSSVSMGVAHVLDQDRHDFSVSLWFQSSAAGWRRMVTKGHYSNISGYMMQYDSGAVAFGIGANGILGDATVVETPGGFGDGRWHHAAAVVDRHAQTIRVYVDGAAQPLHVSDGFCGAASGEVASIAKCPHLAASSNEPFTVGSYEGRAEFFQGALDDVRVYARALGASDVASLAHGP